MGQVDPWVLYQRAVLGLVPQRTVVLQDPYGVIRSREMESVDKAVRCSLGVSERENTVVSRSVSRFGGAGVQQIAIAVDDLLAMVSELRRRGAPLLPAPDNYYDDLLAKYDLEPTFLEALRSSGVLYERGPQGEFLHAYSAPFEDRFEIRVRRTSQRLRTLWIHQRPDASSRSRGMACHSRAAYEPSGRLMGNALGSGHVVCSLAACSLPTSSGLRGTISRCSPS